MARVKYYDQASQEWKYADAALNMKGKDGYTPQKGIDYFTEEDVRELTENVLDQISFDKLTEDLDADGFRITNLPLPQSGSEPATKEFVENFTIEGSTYVATDDGEGNVTIRPYLADEDELVFKSHIQNQNNPHGVTAVQVGARPDTWTPTAEEVGAATPEAVSSAKTAAVTEAKTYTNTQITDRVIYGKGKNLLKNTAKSQTKTGITFTINEDGSVTLNGTATNDCYFSIASGVLLQSGNYILSGCPSGGATDRYILYAAPDTGSNSIDIGNGIAFSTDGTNKYSISIRVTRGVTVAGLTFYPMIRLASETDDTYEPYYEGLKEVHNKLSMELVYENADTSSEYEEVDIPLNCDVDHILVEMKLSTTSTNYVSFICEKNKTTYCAAAAYNPQVRTVWFDKDTINFGYGRYYATFGSSVTTKDNTRMIPYRVYILKEGV